MNLTFDQKEIYDGVLRNVENDSKGFYTLTGPAGVGKTYLTARIIKELLDGKIEIAVTSTTHKSSIVLSKMLESINITLPIKTIHSFLYLLLSEDYKSGTYKLIKQRKTPKKVRMLIVDEASMISFGVWKHLRNYANRYECQILMIGDKYQLPPTDDNGTGFSIFNQKVDHQYILNKILRQSANNPIIKMAKSIRDVIEEGNCSRARLKKILNSSHNGKTINIIHSSPSFRRCIDKAEFKPNKQVFCSHTNILTNSYGSRIHKRIKGSDYLYPGDILVSQKPLIDDKKTIIENSTELKVISCKLVERNFLGNMFNIWDCQVSFCDVGNDDKSTTSKSSADMLVPVLIIDPSSAKLYSSTVSNLRSTRRFDLFFSFTERFLTVKYIYSSTIHKLQGSTIEKHVYIDLSHQLANTYSKLDNEELFRLVYVAITRTRNKVSIFF